MQTRQWKVYKNLGSLLSLKLFYLAAREDKCRRVLCKAPGLVMQQPVFVGNKSTGNHLKRVSWKRLEQREDLMAGICSWMDIMLVHSENREDTEYIGCSLFYISVSLFGSGGREKLSFHEGEARCFYPFACMLYLMRQLIHVLKKSNPKLSTCFHPVSCNFPKANNQRFQMETEQSIVHIQISTHPWNTWRHHQDGHCCFFPPSSLLKSGCCQRVFIIHQKEAEPWLTRARGDQWAAAATHINKNKSSSGHSRRWWDLIQLQLRHWTGFFLCLLLPLIPIKEY